MDETKIMLGHLHSAKHVIAKNESVPHQKSLSTQQSTTINKCILANSKVI